MIQRGILDPLQMFAVVARHRAFNRAAAELGVSTSALSHGVRSLETRLGVRLLNRTTRSVSPTEAGKNLLARLDIAFKEIGEGLDDVGRSRDIPSGTLRLTMVRHAYETVVRPMLPSFIAAHPDIQVEVLIEYDLSNVAERGLDGGIRFGEMVDRDMVAVPVGPKLRMAVVAAPTYLLCNPRPASPADLTQHACLNYRLMRSGEIYGWEFSRGDHAFSVRVDGPLTFNEPELMLDAALTGIGVGYLFEDQGDCQEFCA